MASRKNNGGRLVPVFLLICAALCSSSAQAEVYKWTDKSGKVYYSDKPLTDTAQSVPGTKTTIDPSQAIKALSEKEQDFKKRQEDAAKVREKTDKEAEEARIKQQNCDNARKQMTQLQGRNRLYTTSPDGSRLYMNDADRMQALNNAQQAINKYCN
jgi:hypothetical protein